MSFTRPFKSVTEFNSDKEYQEYHGTGQQSKKINEKDLLAQAGEVIKNPDRVLVKKKL